MLSIPPATMISACPSAMVCAPKMMAFIPEEHTLLTVVHGTLSGSPAPREACLAGAWPRLAETTFPMMTSWTSSGDSFIEESAPAMALAPRAVAESPDNEPPKLPMGVLVAETI